MDQLFGGQRTETTIDFAPAVLWFTGFSGAGKSTVAAAVDLALSEHGVRTELLDGDAVRALSPAGFSRAERDAHVKRVGFLASRLEYHGVTAICALISPYAEARRYVRSLCRTFIEVHVATPLQECERRDAKGLYARVRRGDIAHFTGVDDPYEPPDEPALVLDTTAITVEHAAMRVLGVWGTVAARPTAVAPRRRHVPAADYPLSPASAVAGRTSSGFTIGRL